MLAENIFFLVGNGIQIFRQFMFTTRCYGKTSARRSMIEFAMDYLPQFTKSCLENKHHAFLLKDKGLLKNMETGTRHQTESIS